MDLSASTCLNSVEMSEQGGCFYPVGNCYHNEGLAVEVMIASGRSLWKVESIYHPHYRRLVNLGLRSDKSHRSITSL